MRILEKDLKRGSITLQVDVLDDLWALFNIIREGDIIYAKTTREVKVGEGSQGSRLPMILGIKVQRIEFQQFSNKLRVGGIIIEGPEKYGVKGKHHTMAIGIGDIITIIKDEWNSVELDFIHRFTSRKTNIMVISTDYEETCIGILSEQGVRYLWEKKIDIPSKTYNVNYEELINAHTSSIAKTVIEMLRNEEVDSIIIAGPGEYKNKVKSTLMEKLNIPMYIDTISTGGCQGIREVLGRDIIKQVVGELNIARASSILDEFKELLIKNPRLVAYGIDEVYEASQIAATSKLIIVDELLKNPNDEERRKVFELLKNAYQHRAEIIIVPSQSDIGAELNGFSGIVAILRFELHRFEENPLQ